ncbi:MAG: DMT family transporter [Acidiferrobacterales bacterium]|nr:DMT family transporter [Acidiferrobacterales bacterium]
MNNTNFNHSDNLKLAVISVVVAVLVLSLGDAVVKSLSVSFTIWQIYVVRSCIAIAILAILFKLGKPVPALIPRSLGWTALRSLLLASMWVAYYVALPHIKLSVAAAVYYTIPLFITLFSAVFTGEPIKSKSWFAIVLGFLGVVVMVRPDVDGFNVFALLPLIAAILYALAMILTRTKCLHEDPKVLSLSLNLTFIVMGVIAIAILKFWSLDSASSDINPFLFGAWIPMDGIAWIALAVLGVVVVIGSVLAAVAYQNGPPTTVASFDYFYLAFSVMWGFIFFREVPDAFSMVGMGMIAIAGLIAIRD